MHVAEHVEELVFLVLLKYEIETYSQPSHIFVMREDLQEEGLSVSIEEGQRILINFELLSPFEELDSPQVDFMELDALRGVSSLTEGESLPVHSPKGLYDFLLRKELQDAYTRPHTQILE